MSDKDWQERHERLLDTAKYNSWRDTEGLDAADALGSDPSSVLPSGSKHKNLERLARNGPAKMVVVEEGEEEEEEEEERMDELPKEVEDRKDDTKNNEDVVVEEYERSNSQSDDCVGEGLDAADAEGIDEAWIEHGYDNTPAESEDEKQKSREPTPSITPSTRTSKRFALRGHEASESRLKEKDPKRDVDVDSVMSLEDEEELLNTQPAAMPKAQQSRFVPRDSVFEQSSINLNVKNRIEKGDYATYWEYVYLMSQDWFDFFLSLSTEKILLIVLWVYTVQMIVFAAIYCGISNHCETTEAMSFEHSFAFSLEIATTVGYTLPQDNSVMFFNGCGSWIAIIYIQCLVCLVLNGIILGTIMLRFSRANRRAVQVLFSNKACITCIQGRFYFTFQCFDLQAANSMIGSTVRVFAIFHELQPSKNGEEDSSSSRNALWQTRVMRLIRPNDEIGGKVWLSVPCIVFHEIDCWSPLAPSLLSRPPKIPFATGANRFPHTPQRSTDGRQGVRAQCTCVVCGSSFLTDSALRRHIIYNAEKEKASSRVGNVTATPGKHSGLDPRKLTRPVVSRNPTACDHAPAHEADSTKMFDTVSPEATRDAISERFRRRNIEVVCLVEGTDTITAKTFQARHSYCAQDIEYDSQHSPCLDVGKDGVAEVNLSHFHKIWKGETSNFEEAVAYPSFM